MRCRFLNSAPRAARTQHRCVVPGQLQRQRRLGGVKSWSKECGRKARKAKAAVVKRAHQSAVASNSTFTTMVTRHVETMLSSYNGVDKFNEILVESTWTLAMVELVPSSANKDLRGSRTSIRLESV
jgi:hypothetical protein